MLWGARFSIDSEPVYRPENPPECSGGLNELLAFLNKTQSQSAAILIFMKTVARFCVGFVRF